MGEEKWREDTSDLCRILKEMHNIGVSWEKDLTVAQNEIIRLNEENSTLKKENSKLKEGIKGDIENLKDNILPQIKKDMVNDVNKELGKIKDMLNDNILNNITTLMNSVKELPKDAVRPVELKSLKGEIEEKNREMSDEIKKCLTTQSLKEVLAQTISSELAKFLPPKDCGKEEEGEREIEEVPKTEELEAIDVYTGGGNKITSADTDNRVGIASDEEKSSQKECAPNPEETSGVSQNDNSEGEQIQY